MATNSKKYNRKNYKKYWGSPSAIKKRSTQNKARRLMEKGGYVSKGDGKEVHHKRPLSSGGTNSKKNLKVVSRRSNRQHGASIANRNKKRKKK